MNVYLVPYNQRNPAQQHHLDSYSIVISCYEYVFFFFFWVYRYVLLRGKPNKNFIDAQRMKEDYLIDFVTRTCT